MSERIGVNSSTLVIGATGAGKSALLATAYEYVWETHKRVSLHYASDPGGFPDKLRALMSVGIVRVWQMQSRGVDYSFETADLASKGYWPAIVDPRTGISPHGVKMIPPVVTLYTEWCGHCGQQVGQSIAQATLAQGLCPYCQKVRNRTTAKITQSQSIAKGFEQVGARGYDGLTSISDWYLQDLSLRKDLGGEEGALGGRVQSGDMVFRQNNRAQVGTAQQRAHALIVNSLSIPGQVVMPLWTAIANETTDVGGLTVIGPKLAGDAKTEIATSWFGNVFMAALEEDDKQRKIRRLYLNEFIKNGKRYLCKQRSDSRFVADLVEDPPYDVSGRPTEQFSGFNLGMVLRAQDDALDKSIEEVRAKYPDAPGLEQVPASYGYDVQGQPAAPARVAGDGGGAASAAAAPAPKAASAPAPRARAPQAKKTAGSAAPAQTSAPPAAAAASEPTSPSPLPMEQPETREGAPLAQIASAGATAEAKAPSAAGVEAPSVVVNAPPATEATAGVTALGPGNATHQPAGPPTSSTATQPGAWAPPPGARLGPPRAPAPAPKARPVARPPVK